jgi:hypothetical protein
MNIRTFKLEAPSSVPAEQQPAPAPATRRFGKKVYFSIAAVIAIVIILATVLMVPTGSSEIINLGVKYSPGEVLTYDINTGFSSQATNSSTTLNEASTLTIDVVSVEGNTYTLNYTTTSTAAGYSMTTSHVIQANATDMVNLLTLLPVALESYMGTESSNSTSPAETAIFNQTTAKVGDTWQIPLTTENSPYGTAPIVTVSFVDIQDLTVKSTTYKVFRIDFSQISTEQTPAPGFASTPLELNYNITGTSYLEFGTCKQIQSTLQMTMASSLGSVLESPQSYSTTITYSSTLTSDKTP